MKSFRAGAIDRLRKHILFCRTGQRLCCYLNNMSGAEVALFVKHCAVKLTRGGGELQPAENEKVKPEK